MHEQKKAEYIAHVEMAAAWYKNTQYTPSNPWGGIEDSADDGRYLYEVYKASGEARAGVVWSQALAILALIDTHVRTGDYRCRNSLLRGVKYLLSLQNFDGRSPECFGGIFETVPNCGHSMLRDATTGCFGLNGLYLYTGEADYIERAKYFCEWFMKYGTDDKGWPWRCYNFIQKKGFNAAPQFTPDGPIPGKPHVAGDWQAGGGMCLYYTSKLTGDDRYIEEGFRPIIDKLLDIYDENEKEEVKLGWHGSNPITHGNDDFALISLIAAFRHWGEERMLDRIKERTRCHLNWMAPNGSYPNFGGTFVCGIEHLEYLRLAEEIGIDDYVDEVRESVAKTAEFGMTLQERDSENPLLYGGLYGQSDYGTTRDRIHHRSTGYSMNFYLKYEGEIWPSSFSSYGWEKK